jgi:ADP-heptose:LPS heptosyltransferase
MMQSPASIILIKAHSMGIGDLLRSSAAWRALKTKWPQAQLHLLMLSKHGGYASESFIRSHHLLSSATFITIKKGAPGGRQRSMEFSEIVRTAELQLGATSIDLVIDCEPYGIRTSLLARNLARRYRARSVGIAQFPLRRFFYDCTAPSVSQYIKKNGLSQPMDYTERDFVVLGALDISRNGASIELQVGPEGLAWQRLWASSFNTSKKQVVLNIGCGTLDALVKRPPMRMLVDAMVASYRSSSFTLHLTGADFEKDVNQEFTDLYSKKLKAVGCNPVVNDWAGKCTLNELSGLVANADIMISSDSGPFHIAIALGVPTLGWFNFSTPASYHPHNNVEVHIMPSAENFSVAVTKLMAQS